MDLHSSQNSAEEGDEDLNCTYVILEDISLWERSDGVRVDVDDDLFTGGIAFGGAADILDGNIVLCGVSCAGSVQITYFQVRNMEG